MFFTLPLTFAYCLSFSPSLSSSVCHSLFFCLTFILFHSLFQSLPIFSFFLPFLLFHPPSLSISSVLPLPFFCFLPGKLTERRKSQRCQAELNLCNNSQSAIPPSSETGVNCSWSYNFMWFYKFYIEVILLLGLV